MNWYCWYKSKEEELILTEIEWRALHQIMNFIGEKRIFFSVFDMEWWIILLDLVVRSFIHEKLKNSVTRNYSLVYLMVLEWEGLWEFRLKFNSWLCCKNCPGLAPSSVRNPLVVALADLAQDYPATKANTFWIKLYLVLSRFKLDTFWDRRFLGRRLNVTTRLKVSFLTANPPHNQNTV